MLQGHFRTSPSGHLYYLHRWGVAIAVEGDYRLVWRYHVIGVASHKAISLIWRRASCYRARQRAKNVIFGNLRLFAAKPDVIMGFRYNSHNGQKAGDFRMRGF